MDEPTFLRLEPPVDPDLIDKCCALWETTFHSPFDQARRALAGDEPENRFVLRVALIDGELAGTTEITTSGDDPAIGGVGEVAVPPKFRRRGIAERLFAESCNEFFIGGGETLFLGTENPAAAHLYRKYGFRYIPSTLNMGCNKHGRIPDDVLYDYRHAADDDRSIVHLSVRHRLQVIPFVMAPHEVMVVNRHSNYISTRHQRLHGCMSLFGRFAQAAEQGAVFVCESSNHRLIAIASVTLDQGIAEVDGCALPGELESGKATLEAAIGWAKEQGAHTMRFLAAKEDVVKLAWFQSLGMEWQESERTLNIDGRDAPCLLGELT